MKLLICGDTVPIGPNVEDFAQGDAERLVGQELLPFLGSSDLVVANLETPLADRETPIAKNGPNLIAPTMTARGLAALGIDVVALANNHVMDQGPEGLDSTLHALDGEGIAHFGAGENLDEAAEPFVFEKSGIRIGIYACAEHEFSIAGAATPGANPFDPLYSLDHVAELNAVCDYVVVLYHGGKEHYRYPSPGLMRVCRRLAEKGADLVVCQHSHCVGCMEEWDGSTIVYGQGNFLFDHQDNEFWATGLLLEVNVSDADSTIEYIPLEKKGTGVRLARGEGARSTLDGFWKRSEEITAQGAVERNYAKFAESSIDSYLGAFIPLSGTIGFRGLNRLAHGFLSKALAVGINWMPAFNYLECEAHRELFATGVATKLSRRYPSAGIKGDD